MRNRLPKTTISVLKPVLWSVAALLVTGTAAQAGEADLAIPPLDVKVFFNNTVRAWWLLAYGALVICGTLGISLYLRAQIHRLPAHKSMLDISEIIYQTCKTYLLQQGKFLLMLFVLIAAAISYYLLGFGEAPKPGAPAPINAYLKLALVLLFAVVGMGG